MGLMKLNMEYLMNRCKSRRGAWMEYLISLYCARKYAYIVTCPAANRKKILYDRVVLLGALDQLF
jgi:hypothetical protein